MNHASGTDHTLLSALGLPLALVVIKRFDPRDVDVGDDGDLLKRAFAVSEANVR